MGHSMILEVKREGAGEVVGKSNSIKGQFFET